ncbi:MAG: rod shape-determining protein MreC [Bacteroidetes bacterium]|nr:rod shape-determining protein MreC [Bacteroidota bacterium]
MFTWISEFFSLAKNYFIFALLLALSLFLISTNHNSYTRGLQAAGLVTTAYLEAGVQHVADYFLLSSRNKELLKENARLIDTVAKTHLALDENEQLRQMLNLKSQSTTPLISGTVVGRSSDGGRDFLTLNIGSDEGVRIGDPVVNGSGLVGIISNVSGKFSLVRTLLDADSRIAARLVDATADGLIEAGSYGELKMSNVARRHDVKKGDIVETSTLSSLVPPGIVIGMVSKATDRTGNIFKDITVKPAVDFSSIFAAFVMQYEPPAAAVKLEKEAIKKK